MKFINSRRKHREKLLWPNMWHSVSDSIPKVQNIKENQINWILSKFKTYILLNILLRNQKYQTWTARKYLKITYLIKDPHTECIKNT